jgi:hypothetical protein
MTGLVRINPMSDFLKLRRNGQVLEIVLDLPKAMPSIPPAVGKWAGFSQIFATTQTSGWTF